MEFLRRLFGKKETKIKFSELRNWLAQHAEFSLDKEVNELTLGKVQLEAAIQGLEQVDISEKKVEQKLKNKVEGNKRAYITALKNLNRKIQSPTVLTSKGIDEWFNDYSETIQDFNKRTAKNYGSLRNLVGRELETVVKTLRALNTLAEKIPKAAKQQKLDIIEAVHQKMADIDRTLLREQGQPGTFHKDRARLIDEEHRVQTEIEKLKTSKEFERFTQLIADHETAMKDRASLRAELRAKLLPLEKTIEKYAKEKKKQIGHELLKAHEDSIIAKSEEMSTFLDHLQEAIKKGKLETHNEDDVQAEVETLKKFIQAYPERVRQLGQKIQTMENQLKTNQYEKDVHKLQEQLAKVGKEVAKIAEAENTKEKEVLEANLRDVERLLDKLGHNVKLYHDVLD